MRGTRGQREGTLLTVLEMVSQDSWGCQVLGIS